MKLKNIIIALVIVILLGVAGWAYWYFLMGPVKTGTLTPTPTPTGTGFQPINRPGTNPGGTVATTTSIGGSTAGTQPTISKIAPLRLLSSTPVGGYGSMNTGSTTSVRWIDRGRGNVYETNYTDPTIVTISNTVVPKIWTSVWDKNLTSFVSSLFEDGDETPSTVYAQLVKQTGGATSTTKGNLVAPYELRGKDIAGNVIGFAASPDKSKIFIMINEGGMGVGYVSSFNGQSMTRIFSTPLTQVNIDWPTDNAIAITTKGSAEYAGFLYFVNPKTGTWSKILGPKNGLSTVVSHDGKYVAFSESDKGGYINTGIYAVATGTTTDAVIRTLADKCAWGNFYKDVIYCGVPSEQVSGTYPDDWYLGTLSTTDKIWQVDAVSGEVHILSSIIDTSDRTIDAYKLGLDTKDNYLFFVNKGDLSLWSLDLVK